MDKNLLSQFSKLNSIRRKLNTVFLIVVFSSIALSVSAQKKYTLRINPEWKKKTTQKLSTVINLELNGKKIVTDLTMKFHMTNTAKKHKLYLFDVICTEIKLNANADGTTMSYDSKNPRSNELSKQMHLTYGKLTNSVIKLSLNELGSVSRITSREGADFPFDKTIYIVTELPKQAIGIGESWTSPGEKEQSGVVTETKMTLTEVNEQGYKINVAGKIVLPDKKQVGYIRGFCVLDKKTCMTKIIELTSETTLLDRKLKTITKYN